MLVIIVALSGRPSEPWLTDPLSCWQFEAIAEGKFSQEQPQQAAPGASQRRAGHAGQPPAVRGQHPLQTGPAFHPATLRQLSAHQELLSRYTLAHSPLSNYLI